MRGNDLARRNSWRHVWTMLLLLGAGRGAAGSWRDTAKLSTQTSNQLHVANQKCNQLILHCCVRTPLCGHEKQGNFECNKTKLQQQHEVAMQ